MKELYVIIVYLWNGVNGDGYRWFGVWEGLIRKNVVIV